MATKATKATKTTKTAKTKKASSKKKQVTGLTPDQKKQLLIIGGVVLALVVAVLLFSWISGMLSGEDIAARMPADTALFLQVDVRELSSVELNEIIAAFSEPGADEMQVQNALEDFSEQLGVSFEEDVKPWVGPNIGLGVFDLQPSTSMDPVGSLTPEQMLIAIQSRNNAAADAFITKVVAKVEEQGGTSNRVAYEGTEIVELANSDAGNVALVRLGGIVFVAADAETIQAKVTMDRAQSLAAVPEFGEAMREIPGGQLMTIYFNMDELANMMAMQGSGINSEMLENAYGMYEGFAMGVSVVDEGLKFEAAVQYDQEKLTDAQRQAMTKAYGPLETVERYPADTMLFVGGQTNGAYDAEQLRATLGDEGYEDFEESMELMQQSTGIDVNSLLQAMDREISLGIFPQDTGLVASFGMGLQMIVTSSDAAALDRGVQELATAVELLLGAPLEPRNVAGLQSFVFSDPFMGDAFAMGSGDGFAYLTTDTNLVSESAEAEFESLADSEDYQQTWKSFPNGAMPIVYVQVNELIEAYTRSMDMMGGAPESTQQFSALTKVAVAGQTDADTVRVWIIAFIER